MFNFSENQSVESLEAVPSEFHSFYTQTEEGSYTLQDNEVVQASVSALTGAQKALAAARAEAKGLKGKAVDLSSLGEFGSSVEEIAAGVQARIDELTGQLAKGEDAKINLDKVRQEMQAAAEKARLNDVAQIEALNRELRELLVTNAIREASGDNYDLVAPFVERRAEVVEIDGRRQAVIKDEQGDVQYNGVGAPMSINEYVSAMKSNEKFARLFNSTAPKGADTKPSASRQVRSVSGSDLDRAEMTPTQKIAAGLAAGQYTRNRR